MIASTCALSSSRHAPLSSRTKRTIRALEGAIEARHRPDGRPGPGGIDLEDEGTAEPWLGWIDGKPQWSDVTDGMVVVTIPRPVRTARIGRPT